MCILGKSMPFSLSESTMQGYTNEINFHPLVTFTVFLTHKQRCTLTLTRQDNLTLQQLYLITKQTIDVIEKEDDERVTVLQTICKVNERQFKKIQDCLKAEPPKISKAIYIYISSLYYRATN